MYGPPSASAPDVVDANDVVGRDLRGEPSLAHEALDERRVPERLRLQVLDRDALVQGEVARDHDDADAALGDGLLDEVLAVDERAVREALRPRAVGDRRGSDRRRQVRLTGRLAQGAPWFPPEHETGAQYLQAYPQKSGTARRHGSRARHDAIETKNSLGDHGVQQTVSGEVGVTMPVGCPPAGAQAAERHSRKAQRSSLPREADTPAMA